MKPIFADLESTKKSHFDNFEDYSVQNRFHVKYEATLKNTPLFFQVMVRSVYGHNMKKSATLNVSRFTQHMDLCQGLDEAMINVSWVDLLMD